MKKKTVANIIMVAVILAVICAGTLIAGSILGWFDSADESGTVLTDLRGVINLQRDGVLFPVEENTVLRPGDQISTGNGASASIRLNDGRLSIGENTNLEIVEPSIDRFSVEVTSGEVFADTYGGLTLSFDNKRLSITNAVASLSVRTGTQSVNVYEGTVETAQAGQMITYLHEEPSVHDLSIRSLNDFLMGQIRTSNAKRTLCFTNVDLDQLQADRNQELQDILNSQPTPEVPQVTPSPAATPSAEPTPAASESPSATSAPTPTPSAAPSAKPTPTPTPSAAPSAKPTPTPTPSAAPSAKPTPTPTPTPTPSAKPTPTPTPSAAPSAKPTPTPTPSAAPSAKPTPTPTPTPAPTPTPTPAGSTCTITIRCDTILNNMDSLNPAKVGYVPASGVILYPMNVTFEDGETVFDVLKRVCTTLGIQLEYSWSPDYGTHYIEGINHLYEFDCGGMSGWMYSVNGVFPNYGCSNYPLKNGDVIVFAYSCQGLGTDVGAPEWQG